MFARHNGIDDFYNSMKDEKEVNEGFGREIKHQTHFESPSKPFKKVVSVEGFNHMHGFSGNMKKSFSTNAFEDNDYDSHMCNNSRLSYINEGHSLLSSPFGSNTSLSSMVSAHTALGKVGHFGNRNFVNKNSKQSMNKKKHVASENDFKTKFKTEPCKYWVQNGFCEFGDSCAFAHGKAEIRQKDHVSNKYKTKRCVQFHENGICPYGPRCQFVHSSKKIDNGNPNSNQHSYAKDLESAEVWCHDNPDCLCSRRKNSSRLPIMMKMSCDNLAGQE